MHRLFDHGLRPGLIWRKSRVALSGLDGALDARAFATSIEAESISSMSEQHVKRRLI
ncbi:MAG: hypothetical protein JF606_17885 [Burkholderiales bacterium]|jgi:hypothetical protein|nr:hypothetical protein [Burkholderiales bacterium]